MEPGIQNWEEFCSKVKYPLIRETIVDAWNRCYKLGTNPKNPLFTFLSPDDLQLRIEDANELLLAANSFLDNLSLSLREIPHVITLGDREGWVIKIAGNPDDFGGSNSGFCTGVNWSEKYIGNNGIGTVLFVSEPVLICGSDHFGHIYRSFTSMGVPIRDSKNEVIGAIDLIVNNKDASPGLIPMFLFCAEAIEKNYINSSALTAKLQQVDKLLITGSLLSTTIHDLKNPLTIIRGFAQLGEMSSDQDQRNYFQQIVSEVDGLLSMLNNLVGILGREHYQEVCPGDIIQSILTDIKPLTNLSRISLECSIKSQAKVNLHIELFKRAIHNLLKNAEQAMPDGGRVDIEINMIEDKVLITISDTGSGIPSDIKDNIFKPFVHGSKNGNGLGLYMVYYVFNRIHDGRVWYESQPNVGTSFFIELPAVIKNNAGDKETRLFSLEMV
jgi:transcriptional regulator of acetoin/glycerol metabolism